MKREDGRKRFDDDAKSKGCSTDAQDERHLMAAQRP